MSTVNNISITGVQPYYPYKNQPDKVKADSQDVFINSTKPDNLATEQDLANNGQFDALEAAKNFGKGLVSPITSMFNSPKDFLIGAGMIVGSAALIVATGGAAAPILIAAGVGLGAVQAGKGVYNIATAKDGDEAEKAFYDIGAGTGSVALSAAGAKTVGKGSGIVTRDMNTLTATTECIKSTPKSAVKSFEAIKEGNFKKNFEDFNWFTEHPKPSKESVNNWATTLDAEGEAKFPAALEEVKGAIPEEFRGSVNGRSKDKASIVSKLDRRVNDKVEVYDIDTARGTTSDLIGTRLVMKDATPAQVDKVVASLADSIMKGDITITEINNYRGPHGMPYFSEENVEILKVASQMRGQDLIVLEGPKQVKSSGYTTAQVNITHKNGALGEFQIRGKNINDLAEVEHIPYDLKQGKDITKGIPELKELYKGVDKAAKSMSEADYKQYKNYLSQNYKYCRETELGIPSKKPEFPPNLDKSLSIENLKKLNDEATIIKAQHKEASKQAIS